jgi:hypothetical protein
MWSIRGTRRDVSSRVKSHNLAEKDQERVCAIGMTWGVAPSTPATSLVGSARILHSDSRRSWIRAKPERYNGWASRTASRSAPAFAAERALTLFLTSHETVTDESKQIA